MTRPTTRGYSPCQAKRLTAPRHSTDRRRPLSSDPKVQPHLYTVRAASLLTHQLCRFEPVTPQIVHKEPKSSQLHPEQESGVTRFFPVVSLDLCGHCNLITSGIFYFRGVICPRKRNKLYPQTTIFIHPKIKQHLQQVGIYPIRLSLYNLSLSSLCASQHTTPSLLPVQIFYTKCWHYRNAI